MRYLVQQYKLSDHWYPSDPKKRAKVDEYLDWHHLNLRRGAAGTIFEKVGKMFSKNALVKFHVLLVFYFRHLHQGY